jgi:hypothetical protein
MDGEFCALLHLALHWHGGQKIVLFNILANIPTFFTAPSLRIYLAFATTFEAMDAWFFQRETVLQVPGCTLLREDAEITPEKFVAQEGLHWGKRKRLINNKANKDNKTICMSNVLDPPEELATPNKSIRHWNLTLDQLPLIADDEDAPLAVTDNLMQRQYHLGHLSFLKLKQLALNGKIPKKLSKLKSPKCTGCLFGVMTKLPWCGKDSASSHKVFVATKRGETVSVDQMESTKVGFFAQVKGTLTKKRYKYCTMFVDHYSRLCFVHLQINNSADKTIFVKQAFEKFAAKHGARIQHYHFDSRHFSDNTFKQSCKASHQQLTFCGANAHFQNGISKHTIWDLLESAHKQLLHAHACWPVAVHFAFWPHQK